MGDTDLYVEITKDLCVYGDEVVYGGGKTLRDGMGMANTITAEGGTLDLVITNVTIIDPVLGVIKADVGVKDGKIAGELEGTWELTENNNITLTVDGDTYHGVVLKQWDEDGKKYVMTFTALNAATGISVWGSGLGAVEADAS